MTGERGIPAVPLRPPSGDGGSEIEALVQPSNPSGIRVEIADRLAAKPRSLPARFFYDELGAQLFDEITQLDEYYLTDVEIGILRDRAEAVARHVGSGVRMVEYGSGSGEKTWIVLDHLESPAAYVPVDVARRQLMDFAGRVATRYPELEVLPVVADYTRLESLPFPEGGSGATLAFFPGSTVGNLEPDEAVRFMDRVREQTGPRAFLLIGVDLVKDPQVLERAYNDARGVTARFNLNILRHLNRLIGADFDLTGFHHRAVWNPDASRVEMHLVSGREQVVALGPDPDHPRFTIGKGEWIVTEHSYKYDLEDFSEMAFRAGYREVETWIDDREWFSVRLVAAE